MLTWLKSNHQVLTAVGAMIVGLAALYVAWDQSRVMRAQQHGAVVPALQVDAFTNTGTGDLNVGIRIANNGVGPAFVRNISVTRDGERVDDIEPMFSALPGPTDRSWVNMTGRVIAPGELVTPISVIWPMERVTPEAVVQLFDEWERWETEICYCSVFDRCWVATIQVPDRRPVNTCPDPGEDIFERYGAQQFNAPEAALQQAGDDQ